MNNSFNRDPNLDPQSRKIGIFMLFVACILFMVIVTKLFSIWLDQQNNPNRNLQSNVSSKGVKEVILKVNRQGYYVVDGLINGEVVHFLLDTGASDVSVPGNLASQLDLKKGAPLYASTASGDIKIYSSTIKKLEIGPILLEDVSANINPKMEVPEVLLGMSALKRLEFEQNQGILILRQYPKAKN